MSKGLGTMQRATLLVLGEAKEDQLPKRELRRRLDNPDRSNLRRTLRSLMGRGSVEECASSEIKLTFQRGRVVAAVLIVEQDPVPDPLEEMRRDRLEFEKAMSGLEAARREEVRLRKEKADLYPDWLGFKRMEHRLPGDTQSKVLRILWDYSDPFDAGLPVRVVKRIIDEDRSNVRRAIKSLFKRGCLDQSPDEKRIRISKNLFSYYKDMIVPAGPLVCFPEYEADEEWALCVLEEQEEWLPQVVVWGNLYRKNESPLARLA